MILHCPMRKNLKSSKESESAKRSERKAEKEISRFKSSLNSPAESGVIRTYIETLLEMPWDKAGKDNQDIKYAEEVLEADHYGLEQVKERILEFLAVRSLTKKGRARSCVWWDRREPENIDRQISCKGTEEAVCKDFTWRSAG